ncbi:sigma-54-dependent transcriptional regulator [Numidum massiliense]|uniref:sigma-54-dependent transcriptional regulator n=1 Tax=Numidum massiliense TaxID=1522315 RepID=UPI0006D5A718|nr:sigma-54 dependent transcriptional regulator [Numidum massiliense]
MGDKGQTENVRILIVDDEFDLLQLLVRRLNRKGFQAKGVTSAEEALPFIKNETFDVAIYDIRLEKMDGMQLLKKTKVLQPEVEVLMLTGHGTIDTAIEAMKLGAYDYLTKPYNLSELEVVIGKAYEKKRLREKNEDMKQLIETKESGFHIVGESAPMREVKGLTKQVADSDVPIAIEGETGTGKELFAKALHYWSYRKDEPFVTVNAGALPEQLLESELFGHVKGAFTGAQQAKKGLVEVASGGTLFLDELGEMPPTVQVKLLRFLESGEFRRVGDVRLRHVNVRVVTATNRNMAEEVAAGRFREDLYYRLNVIKIVVPPLRERKEDIPELVDYYVANKARWKGKRISPSALSALQAYDFPGNVRELFHLLERGFLLARGDTVEAADLLPQQAVGGAAGTRAGAGAGAGADANDAHRSLAELEREHIRQVLRHTEWNKTEAAQILGVSVRNLYRKIEQYELKE